VKRWALGCLVSVSATACYQPCSGRPAPLPFGLSSQERPEAVKQKLKGTQKWEVVKEERGPTDGRPRFDFTLVSVGLMSDRGHTGEVQLWFYNDRLMSVYFSPADPAAYLSAIRQLPGAKVRDQDVTLPGGVAVWPVSSKGDRPIIVWEDLCLRDETNSWVSRYS
jgi:hypothetical protein